MTFAPARPHGGESGVTGGIEKRYFRFVVIEAVSPDVLGDPARFPRRHPGLADGIHQRRLPVIDMAHERDDRVRAA